MIATLSKTRNPWPADSALPRGPAAALAALHLGEPRMDGLVRLNDREWRQALDFCGRSQITLALRRRACHAMPGWVREVTDRNLAHNLERLRRLQELYRFLSARLAAEGIEFLALKGLTHCPEFGAEPQDRPQYDVDVYIPRETIIAARDALLATGFEIQEGLEAFPTDHLPALIRKTGWQWRGDVFDPEMPLAIELHFQFWNGATERLDAPGVEEFWRRRITRRVAGIELAALCAPDSLGYAALHVLRHILQGSGRPFHVFEVASFLESHAGDRAFWTDWRAVHSPELRRLQAVAFRLASAWFGCELAPAAREEVEQLPSATQAWFDEFALSPARRLFQSNKDELWLHLSLLASRRDAFLVARRRLFPGRLPPPVDAIHIPRSQMRWHRRVLKGLRWSAYSASRLIHHAAALPGAVSSGARWWWKINRLGGNARHDT
ncbi:MAG TPA: nucleotidyltransferase family protein [Bryobacteraceae bacterium]|nr:nucleotidyltransferase family protein [Bryobacteraceae bacterium]